MNTQKKHNKIKLLRKARSRAKLYGTAQKPRLSIFKSNRFTYAQLIDDSSGKTLASASTMDAKTGTKVNKAELLGEKIAKKAIEKNISSAIFDRGDYRFHGRVKAVAEAAKKAGLKI